MKDRKANARRRQATRATAHMKTCHKCGVEFEFCNLRGTVNSVCSSRCADALRRETQSAYHKTELGKLAIKRRTRKHNLKTKFGITVEDYEELLAMGNGMCWKCGKEDQAGSRLAVDHDHVTGLIRGLLCRKCNQGIGLLGDSVEGVRDALDYLERHLARNAAAA